MKLSTLVVLAGALLASTSETFALTDQEQVDQFYKEKYGVVTRRLEVGSDTPRVRRRLAAGAFASLLGAIDGVSSTVKGVTSAVQGVVNLFGKQSSESIVNSLTNRGFNEFSAKTKVMITSMHTSVFDSYVKDQIRLLKIPSKHNQQVNSLLKKATSVYKQEWINIDTTFDEKSGGYARNFQLMTYRDHNCETMHMVIVEPNIKYKLKEDLFIISKSKSSMGGAFSKTKLDFKSGKMPKSLDVDTLKFVNEYFQTMALAKLAESRRIVQTESYTEPCLKNWQPPPKQICPWCDEMDEDDEEAGGFSAEAGYEKDGKYAKVKWEQDEEDDEEAGGFSAEAGYEKDGKYAKVKWEQDEMDDEEAGRFNPNPGLLRDRSKWSILSDELS